jgi:hypothetical protein
VNREELIDYVSTYGDWPDKILALIDEARKVERERCAKAICPECAKGSKRLPYEQDSDGWYHETPPYQYPCDASPFPPSAPVDGKDERKGETNG